MELSAQDALDKFRQLLNLTNVVVYDNEMRYRFKNEGVAKQYEDIATRLIMVNRLPLLVEREKWEKRGVVFEINLVIAYVPSMEELPCY